MDDVLPFILLGMFFVIVPFILPIALWVSLYRTKKRVAALEQALEDQKATTQRLSAALIGQRETAARAGVEVAPAPAASAPAAAVPPSPPRPAPAIPLPVSSPPVVRERPAAPPPSPAVPPSPVRRASPSTVPVATPTPSVPSPAPATSPTPQTPASVPPAIPSAPAVPPASAPRPDRPAPAIPPSAGPPRAPMPPRPPSAAAPAPADGAGSLLRLGERRRRQDVLRDRRHRADLRGGPVPALLGAAGVAAAADSRADRDRGRRRAARAVRDEGGAQLSGDGQRARCRSHRDPVRNLLCRARAVEPDPGDAHVRAARRGNRPGGAALDQAGVAVHRGARPARRVRDAGAAVDGGEPSDSAVRLPGVVERRPGVGGLQAGLAGADDPHTGPHDRLPVDLGLQVPERERPAAGDGDLHDLPDPERRGDAVRPPRPEPRPRRGRRDVRTDDGDRGGAAAAVRRLSGDGAGVRRATRPPLWLPAAHRRRPARGDDRAEEHGAPGRGRARHAAGVGGLAGDGLQRERAAARAGVRGGVRPALSVRADDRAAVLASAE